MLSAQDWGAVVRDSLDSLPQFPGVSVLIKVTLDFFVHVPSLPI